MIYSKKGIGEELKLELSKGYSIERISDWASDLYFSSRGDFTDEINEILRFIYLMDAGPEFIHSQQELNLLAELLIKEDKDPIKQILL